MNGTGSGSIVLGDTPLDAVPPGADIAAAFLYWQVVIGNNASSDSGGVGVTFRGTQLSSTLGPFGKVLGVGTPPCWSGGGGTGGSNGSKKTYTYRADVLRYFDVDSATGKLQTNGTHSVSVPNTGNVEALGASLVVIYRDSTKPLSAIVLYDGAYTMDQQTEGMFQTLKGFYQAGTSAKITHIVGSGQLNKSEVLYYNGAPLATNPFRSSLGPQWDNPTFEVPANAGASQVTTSVDHAGFNSFDCLTWAAVVFRTTVQDSDGDGLLDVWETSTAASPIVDPAGQALPALGDMGASVGQQDLFIEVGYLKTDADTSYGGATKPAHSHLPTHEVLKLVGDAFDGAPTGRIKVHFDVGATYPPGDPLDPANNAEAYLVPRDLAAGGEAINESVTVCTPAPGAPPWECQFAAYPGTVGWKAGFRFLRDEVLSVTPTPAPTVPPTPLEDYCDRAGYTCNRRFDGNRMNAFHYALFAHAVGLPKSEFPCLNGTVPVPGDASDACTAPLVANPDFRIPRTNTGIGDFPGGDALITLGGFPDVSGRPVGTPFMQASTLMHELGHNFERRHGGEALELNCRPTYFSVMNYLYQLRGLLDDSGQPRLDFSQGVGTTVNENGLSTLNYQPYRLGWYAPLATSYLAGRRLPAARHCNGSGLLPTDVPTVRIDARTAAADVDWDADNVAGFSPSQDVNFDGALDAPYPSPLTTTSDWARLALNQVGSRRNVGGLYVDPVTGLLTVGPLSANVGKGDLGKGDLGKGDLGKGDLGKGDLGKGDLGKGDLGKGDLGKGDLGKGDLGGGDLFLGDPNNPSGELDAETAGDLARTPPNGFRVCVIGVDCTGTPAQLHRVRVAWTSPNVGGVQSYRVYRVATATLEIGQTWQLVGSAVPAVLGQTGYSVVDDTQLTNGAPYTYFAVARYADSIESDASNLVTILGVNDPPKANDDAYVTDEDTALTVTAPAGVLANDSDPDTASTLGAAVVVSAPAHGSLTLNPNGAFAYTPAANYNGPDSFTYQASDGTVDTNVATVTLTVNAVNDAPTAAGDSYSTAEDTALNVAAPGVLAGDADVDGDALTAVFVNGPANGTLTLNGNGAFTYTPALNFGGADAFSYKANDGTANSGAVTVTIAVSSVNDRPTISDIADRSIDANTNSGALAFTIGDVDGLTGVTVSGDSSNTTLVPAANIVFGGSAANRTVTVSPAANQSGTATITVTITDAGGLTASDTFVLTVRQPVYTFVAVQNIPPAAGKTFRAGSSIPLGWKYQNGTTLVDSSTARFEVNVVGPLPNPTINNTDSGQSSFRYSSGTWSFNLQTKTPAGVPYPVGTYQVTVKSLTAGFPSSAPFTLQLVK